MFNFHPNLYTDVRIETMFNSEVYYRNETLDTLKEREYTAAFIRVFDGNRWYYASTSDVDTIQEEIDALSLSAEANPNILEHEIISQLEVNTGDHRTYTDNCVKDVSLEEKHNLMKEYMPFIKDPLLNMYKLFYSDKYIIKHFYSSKGSDLIHDTQSCGMASFFSVAEGEKTFSDAYMHAGLYFDDVKNKEEDIVSRLNEVVSFLKKAEPIEKGEYTVILSPLAAGVFAHESFGHKSEADFMIGDENMKKEWAIGSDVASPILSIIDDGNLKSTGYTPFDDEGSRAHKTFLIKDGKLSGRLHSANTAASLEEKLTGNARAVDFEYEPIVRMTTTYIASGDKTLDQLISEVDNGILVKTIKHGSGMSTFTIAPSMSYRIKNGKVCDPVNVALLTGTVFDTLNEIDGLSDKVEILSFISGGCGKFEQFNLPVGFGGPYVRVKKMNVQ